LNTKIIPVTIIKKVTPSTPSGFFEGSFVTLITVLYNKNGEPVISKKTAINFKKVEFIFFMKKHYFIF